MPMLCRRFQPVKVPEPSVDETYQILLGLRERYEAHHKLTYTDEALRAAAKFSSQYISDRFLPDKVNCTRMSFNLPTLLCCTKHLLEETQMRAHL